VSPTLRFMALGTGFHTTTRSVGDILVRAYARRALDPM
jgi:hypothetical protein